MLEHIFSQRGKIRVHPIIVEAFPHVVDYGIDLGTQFLDP